MTWTGLPWKRGCSSAARRNIGQDARSRIGWRSTASGREASTSPSSCCTWSTSRIHPDGWGYTQFCAHYHRWLGRQDVVMRFEYVAGERMFVDFCGDTLPITDPKTGEIWQAQVFACALGASGYLYVEVTGSQDLTSWQGAHVNALEFYGSSPRVVVPDYVARHIIGLLCPTGL